MALSSDPTLSSPGDALPGYHPTPGRFDEARQPDGSPRDTWRPVVRALDALGAGELDRRRRDAGRLVDAQGAGHIFHDDGSDASRPWRLDPVPYVIGGQEWAQIERGISQRARLLELVLRDLYGPQDLLRQRRIHPAAVFGTPAWCPPVQGLTPAGGRWLTLYGADLVRTADGQWRVLRDHTDAPAGAGYALLNRGVLGVLLPEISRGVRVLPLGPFFAAYRDALATLAPAGSESPRTVVLSSGLGHPSYFEHSYLATNMGYHLAEAGDVAVAGGRAWLRSVSGLEPVDVLVRRLDGSHVDPLEQPGAATGVPGLVNAVRAGGVGIGNAIGAGLACSLTIQRFLDDLAPAMLGEQLGLVGLEALWCGEAAACATVLADPSSLVLHDVGGPDGAAMPSAFGDELDDIQWSAWADLLSLAPHRVVAQPRVRFATSPVLTEVGLVPGTVVLRVLAVVSPDGITVLPGGLARIVDPTRPVVNQVGGLAKDAWILDDQPQRPPLVALPRLARMPQVDLSGSLLVRSAEAMTWVSRDAERAEALARSARSALTMVQDDPTLLTSGEGAWRRFVTRSLMRLAQRPTLGDEVSWAEAIATAEDALAQRIESLARTASGVRSFMSGSTWLVMGELTEIAQEVRSVSHGVVARVEQLDAVIMRLAALSGFAIEGTVRGPAWRYLDLGRRLERALVVLDTLDAVLGPGLPGAVRADAFDHVLRSNESLIAYRRRFRSDAELPTLLDLLVRDHTNPRSLTFQLDLLREHLVALPSRDQVGELPALVDEAARAINAADPLEVPADQLVARLVDGVRVALNQLNTRLVAIHFADPVLMRPMGTHW